MFYSFHNTVNEQQKEFNVERYKCTKESPWTEDKGKAYHPDAIELYEDV